MGLVPMGGQEYELLNPMVFPLGQELIEGSMEGLSPETRRAGVVLLFRAPDPELEGGRLEDREAFGKLTGHSFGDEGVGSQRKVGTMLNQSPYRQNQAGIPGQGLPDFRPW